MEFTKSSKGYPKLKRFIEDRADKNEIAELIDSSVSWLNDCLVGKNGADFTHKEVIKICLYLNLTPDDLF